MSRKSYTQVMFHSDEMSNFAMPFSAGTTTLFSPITFYTEHSHLTVPTAIR